MLHMIKFHLNEIKQQFSRLLLAWTFLWSSYNAFWPCVPPSVQVCTSPRLDCVPLIYKKWPKTFLPTCTNEQLVVLQLYYFYLMSVLLCIFLFLTVIFVIMCLICLSLCFSLYVIFICTLLSCLTDRLIDWLTEMISMHTNKLEHWLVSQTTSACY